MYGNCPKWGKRYGTNSIIHAGAYCVFNTQDSCTIAAGDNCKFNIGDSCVVTSYSATTINPGNNCVLIRKDIHEIYNLVEREIIRLNGHCDKGYSVIRSEDESHNNPYPKENVPYSKPIIGQEAITSNGLGRVIKIISTPCNHFDIIVKTYHDNVTSTYCDDNVELIDPRRTIIFNKEIDIDSRYSYK